MKLLLLTLLAVTDVPEAEEDGAAVGARIAMAQQLARATDAHSVVDLWLLATDANKKVQAAALVAVTQRCPKESRTVCVGMLRYFLANMGSDSSWEARDRLLKIDPAEALRDAEQDYKLELVASLTDILGRPDAKHAAPTLRLLAMDPDPDVQEAASLALIRQP